MATHRQAFIRTHGHYKVTGAALHRMTGISANQISEYLNNKRDMRTETLDRLLRAIEQLHPGALQFYSYELMEGEQPNPCDLIDGMDDDQIAQLMFAIAKRMSPSKTDTAKNKELSVSG